MRCANPALVEVKSMTVGMTANSASLWREATRLREQRPRRVFQVEDFLLTASFIARLNATSVGNCILQLPDTDAKRFLVASICSNAQLAACAVSQATRDPVQQLAFVRELAAALSSARNLIRVDRPICGSHCRRVP